MTPDDLEASGESGGILVALLEIASASAAADDLDHLLAAIALELGRLFPLDRADAGLVEDDILAASIVSGRETAGAARAAGRYPLDASHHLGWVVSRGEPVWRNDIQAELRFRETLPRAGMASDMAIPLRSRGRVTGALRVASRRTHAYEPEDYDLLQRLADLLAVAVENQRLLEANRRMAEVDGLTGVCNQRHFRTLLARETARSRHIGQPLALVMVDIDHFKRVNDTHGHPAGDAVLRHVAGLLARRVRRSDVVARCGGEEFAVLLPGSDAAAASTLAEEIRTSLGGEPAPPPAPGSPPLAVTASFGVAALPADASSEAGLVEAADQALYRAKRAGRNRVERATPPGA
jgi:diguanylate cyclase (GGDEF)-like protein